MENKRLFIEFIELNRAETTAKKYSTAINTISEEMIGAKIISDNIYIINDISLLEQLPELYRANKDLYDKDERGNRMYSCALKKYAEFYRDHYIVN